MSKLADSKKLWRILDANFNRTKEGLRVCEDICRYAYDSNIETRQLKKIRHDLTTVLGVLNIRDLLLSREVESDVGRKSTASEFKREDLKDVFYANAQRVKESLRVLEEVLKLLNPDGAQNVKNLRYQFYAIEKKMVL